MDDADKGNSFNVKAFFAEIFLLASGSWLLITGWHRFRIELNSKRWPMITGVVVTSEIQRVTATGRGGQECLPLIEYEYPFNGALIRSRFEFDTFGDLESATAVTQKYPLQASIEVRVNPKNPKESSLRTGLRAGTFALLILGVVAFGLSLFALMY